MKDYSEGTFPPWFFEAIRGEITYDDARWTKPIAASDYVQIGTKRTSTEWTSLLSYVANNVSMPVEFYEFLGSRISLTEIQDAYRNRLIPCDDPRVLNLPLFRNYRIVSLEKPWIDKSDPNTWDNLTILYLRENLNIFTVGFMERLQQRALINPDNPRSHVDAIIDILRAGYGIYYEEDCLSEMFIYGGAGVSALMPGMK